MTEVIDFATRLSRFEDDAAFMECAACGASEFAVVTRRSSDKRFIAALVCVQCPDTPESLVVNGFVD